MAGLNDEDISNFVTKKIGEKASGTVTLFDRGVRALVLLGSKHELIFRISIPVMARMQLWWLVIFFEAVLCSKLGQWLVVKFYLSGSPVLQPTFSF